MKPAEGREQLLGWMWGRSPHTTTAMLHFCSAYWDPFEWDIQLARCRRDLSALEREGKVRRLPRRPARWEVVR